MVPVFHCRISNLAEMVAVGEFVTIYLVHAGVKGASSFPDGADNIFV